jgi:NAD(P)-dependent dehydrogenase (short-subunit alcohol dehydrogenase family)
MPKPPSTGITAPLMITANVVAPGYIRTDMTAELPEDVSAGYAERIPANRFGEPEVMERAMPWSPALEDA